MDLPTCPACGQSVLDDDPQVCPFCGSSMTGKPVSGKPAPGKSAPAKKPPSIAAPSQPKKPQAAQKGTQSSKPSPTKPSGQPTSAKKPAAQDADEDHPFDMSTDEQRRAVPAAPRPMKGRTYEVKCPMCETPGFVPRKAIGHPARCANKECMVPIFTIPAPPKVDTDDEDDDSSSGLSLGMIIAGVLLLGLAAGGGWYFVSQREAIKPPTNRTPGNGTVANSEDGTDDTPANTADENSSNAPDSESTNEAPTISLSELRVQLLDRIDQLSLTASGGERGPYCRRLASIAFAQAGDVDKAEYQRQRLASMSLDQPFFQIDPLVQMAWQDLVAEKAVNATQRIDKALKASESLPSRGRERLDSAIQLASILIAVQRDKEALDLIETNQSADHIGQLSARLHNAYATKLYDYDQLLATAPLFPLTRPQTVGVVVDLVTRGKEDQARRWADLQTSSQTREECYIAWAETCVLTHDDAASHLQELESIAGQWSPARQAELYARVAVRFANQNKKEQAAAYQQRSAQILTTINDPGLPGIPDTRTVFNFQVANRDALKVLASAAYSLAHVNQLLGNTDGSWQAMQKCLSALRANSLSTTVVDNLLDRASSGRNSQLVDELKQSFVLRSSDAVERKLRDYRQQCRRLMEDAEESLNIQTSALQSAINWGLGAQVWQEVKTRIADKNPQTHVNYMQTTLPTTLLENFRDNEQTDIATSVEGRLTDAGQRIDPWERELAEARRALKQDNPQKALTHLFNLGRDRLQRGEAYLRLACWSAKNSSKIETALTFVKGYQDEQFREQALETVIGLATRQGRATDCWKWIQETSLNGAETVSGLFGLVIASLGAENP